MDIGLCTISSKSRSVERIMDLAVEVGVSTIEVWGQDHVGSGEPARCREMASAAADRDLTIGVYGSYLRAGTDGFGEAMNRELRIATDLDAEYLRVWAGQEEYQDVSADHREAVIDDLTSLGRAAADTDVAITVERHAGTVTNTIAGAKHVIDATPATVGLNWQPMFSQSASAVAEDIDTLAPLTNNVHLQAKPTVDGDERCPLAFAYFDVAEIVGVLERAGYGGYLEIEFVTDRSPYGPAVAADVAFLEAILADLD